jgi:site-specific recombinase XerD
MLEELERRNYAQSTIHAYIRTVEHYSRHFRRSPDQLGPEHIRQYQAAMFREWKLAPNTVTQKLAALRFFYVQVLKRGWSVAETPYPKKVLHLPQVLSPQEIARLIDAAEMPFHRILLMTLYATGARRAEVAHLKVSDIDSQRMVVHIQGGKGRKDRDAGILRVTRSRARFSGRPASMPPNVPASSTSTSIRIRCAIASPPICSKLEQTCAPSRSCLDIAT